MTSSLRNCTRPAGSSPLAGSSSSTKSGPGSSVRASPIRCFIPRDSPPIASSAFSASQSFSSQNAARSSRSAPTIPYARPTKPRNCRGVSLP